MIDIKVEGGLSGPYPFPQYTGEPDPTEYGHFMDQVHKEQREKEQRLSDIDFEVYHFNFKHSPFGKTYLVIANRNNGSVFLVSKEREGYKEYYTLDRVLHDGDPNKGIKSIGAPHFNSIEEIKEYILDNDI